MAVWAVVALDFPARDSQLLAACGEVARGSAWADQMVPAVLARKDRDAKFGDAHVGVFRSSNVEVGCSVGGVEWRRRGGGGGGRGCGSIRGQDGVRKAATGQGRVAIWGRG